MMVFDAADREVCSVKRRLTNTPLQALNLLNDPTYVEASRWLASSSFKAIVPADGSDAVRIRWLFRKVLARLPDRTEQSKLEHAIIKFRDHFAQPNEWRPNSFMSERVRWIRRGSNRTCCLDHARLRDS